MADSIFSQEIRDFSRRIDLLLRSVGNGGRAEEHLQQALAELQQAHEELRQQNEALGQARDEADAERARCQEPFHFAPDGCLVTDLDGAVFEANRAAAALLGVPERFLAGKPLVLFIEEQDRLKFRSEVM
jgi:PAS domain-containing protein